MLKVCWICCFCGRHRAVERVIRCFLEQDYKGHITLLLYNNSPISQELDKDLIMANKSIMLVNNALDFETDKGYKSTGAIFRDALKFVPEECTLVTFSDSDDLFLPNHTTAGVNGYLRGKKKAYKPHYSYFLYGENNIELAHNTLEPSIFVEKEFLQKEGFHYTSATYHQKWEQKLKAEDNIFVDKDGPPTFLYDWSAGHETYKISGSGDDGEDNFRKHREFETDFGDGVLSPAALDRVEPYFNLTFRCQEL